MKTGIWKKVIIAEIILFIALCGFMFADNTFSREDVDLKVNDAFKEYVGAECDFSLTGEEEGAFLYEGTVESGETIVADVEYSILLGKYNITKMTYNIAGSEGSAEVTRVDLKEFIPNIFMIIAAGDLVAWFIISWRKGTLGEQKVFGRKKAKEKKPSKGPTL
ncbi:MAG: hypothetical protein IKT31_09785 [Firmicutes bacterium]|nr:hypothetical protein [Bacillota bacterium]